jgi:hypothetical protein
MTELKGIKLEDLNVTKEKFIKLIGLLNLDLELPNDERIIFDEEVEKFESGQVIAFYHLLVYGDNLYNFCLSFFLSSLTSNSFHLSGYSVDICNFSNQYLLDCLYESGILTPVEEEDNPEQTSAEDAEELENPEQPVEDAEEQDNPEQTPAEENKQGVELTLLERNLFEAHEKANDYYEQSIELGNEKFASSYLSQCDLLLKMIIESGLFSKYTVWLIQRNQKTAGASK